MTFDSSSINELLDGGKDEGIFNPDFPVFYKNRIRKLNNKNKFHYLSPIDSALKFN